jgi:hypothetical protein
VAALMHALADRVQFVLATPTNAESLRLSWCDLQLAFLPRDPGRAYSPPIRLLSRLGVGDLEDRGVGDQPATETPPPTAAHAVAAPGPSTRQTEEGFVG